MNILYEFLFVPIHATCPAHLILLNLDHSNYTWRVQVMLGGSLFTTAWRALRLQMEETPSRYGGQLRMYWIRSREQPTRGGPPAWGFGVGPTTPHRKK
jgi:hypothetical protein